MRKQAHEHAAELYRACPRWCLDWAARGPGILAEIGHWDPDIGCLQEVDRLEQVQTCLERRGCACSSPDCWGEHASCILFALMRSQSWQMYIKPLLTCHMLTTPIVDRELQEASTNSRMCVRVAAQEFALGPYLVTKCLCAMRHTAGTRRHTRTARATARTAA